MVIACVSFNVRVMTVATPLLFMMEQYPVSMIKCLTYLVTYVDIYMNPKPMDITRKEHHQTTETDAEAGSGVADGSTRQ